MTDHQNTPPVDPSQDVVPGEPPVPITVWHLPRPSGGIAASPAIIRRLTVNYTRPGSTVADLTSGRKPSEVPPQAAALVVTTCPAGHRRLVHHVADCADLLHPGGCLAVMVAHTDVPDRLGPVVAAGRAVGLTYVQHLVIAHQLTEATPADAESDGGVRAGGGRAHLKVHTDVLVLRASPQGSPDA